MPQIQWLAFAFVAILIALPSPFIWLVDPQREDKDASALSKNHKSIGADTYDRDTYTTQRTQEAEALQTDGG